MKLKNYIKLKENTQEQRSESVQAKYDALMEQVRQNEAEYNAQTKKISLWKILSPIMAVACAVAITLTCIFTLNSPRDLVYNDDKIINVESNFNDLQADSKYFKFNIEENNIDNMYMSYDSESGDKLFYRLFANLNSSKLNLYVVINKNYNYSFELTEEPTVKSLAEYKITYTSESSRGKPEINYKGWIKVETETVYFNYIQKPALGDEAFFESIQQIIKLK